MKEIPSSEKFDYAAFGSSRTFYNLDPLQIEKETGLKGVNMGYPGANTFEIMLMVKMFLQKFEVKRIFIQVDDQYNKSHYDRTAIIPFMPFIHDDIIYENIKKVETNAVYLKYIPFYRYMKYDSKLGFRELMMTSFNEVNQFEVNYGYAPTMKKNMKESNSPYKFKLKDVKNKHIVELLRVCKEEQVEVMFYTSPIYNPEGNLELLNTHLPNYKDFSNSILAHDMFNDPYHLNTSGTKMFTNLFITTYFEN
ncbi:hypothetical protein [Mangrovimonas yunxiaonensis]|nr:hypothetical protein [Mangrovimonas yunxiaonensis]